MTPTDLAFLMILLVRVLSKGGLTKPALEPSNLQVDISNVSLESAHTGEKFVATRTGLRGVVQGAYS